VIAWCKQRTVQFTRSHPYKKNDNCQRTNGPSGAEEQRLYTGVCGLLPLYHAGGAGRPGRRLPFPRTFVSAIP
jgi:hypothetical protein